ncbi:hypothetical protein QBC42DRAFT_318778 [Cladorrhinum samala]|uniref:Rhodopsin domain-containing protein n=1 Tax=Cladorrhinum samala TaxID=585594 RepID=A0AAV9H8C2_9PEZI|nr:hypothetical protein QBC42DRAFT_318778 [Cladorrhinum samala]
MENDDRGPQILTTTWSLVGISGVFLALRLYCKLKTKRLLWWDDYVLAFSWLMLLTSIILNTVSISKGFGRHVQFIPAENSPTIGLIGNLMGTFSIFAAVWSKTAFAITLLRVMQGRTKIFLWFIICTINIFMGLNAVFMWIRCSPSSKIWNYYSPGTCWEPTVYPTYGMFAAGYSAVTDFVLALLPWKVVWKLQMKRKEKAGVAIAMSLGVFAGATALVKTTVIPSLASPDFSYVAAPLIHWSTAESAVTIIAASIPILRILFRDLQSLTRRNMLGSEHNTEPTNPNSSVSSIVEISILGTQSPLKITDTYYSKDQVLQN